MQLADTHCHLDSDSYDKDRDEVIERATEAGVRYIVAPASDAESSTKTVDLVRRYENIYVAVGIHPNASANFTRRKLRTIETLARKPKVVAIGEVGLDYYRDHSPKPNQRRALEAQLALAAMLELPVILHNRESDEDLLTILENWTRGLPAALKERPGVLHSFSAPQEIADRALALGFYLSFSGLVTFKKAHVLRQIAETVPLDRILAETDGPYLTPEPYRGKRNEPAYVAYVVGQLAEVKAISPKEMARFTTENAVRLFQLT